MMQHIKISKASITYSALFCFLIASTVSFASTNIASRGLIENLRILATLGIFVLTLLQIIYFNRVSRQLFFALCLFVGYMLYGTLQFALHGAQIHATSSMTFSLIIIGAGAYIFAQAGWVVIPLRILKAVSLFSGLIFLFTILVGGFVLSFPPHFVLDYLSLLANLKYDASYSQGITKFYGLASIAALIVYIHPETRSGRAYWLMLLVLFMLLSLLGGSRGESVASFCVVMFGLFKYARRTFFAFSGVMCVTLIIIGVAFLEEFTLFQRFAELSSQVGRRQYLLSEAFALLAQRPDCLLIGCGFYYYQAFHGFAANLYPHNVFIELVIVLGLPVTFCLVGAAALGIWRRSAIVPFNEDGLVAYFVMYVIIGLKSGSVLSSWFLMAGLFYFATVPFINLSSVKIRKHIDKYNLSKMQRPAFQT